MRVFIKGSDRFIGYFVGTNPITLSCIVYDDNTNTYKSYHEWQIEIVK